MSRTKINDGLTKDQRYRLKDIEAYRKRKREYANTPEERRKRVEYMRVWREKNRARHNELARQSHARNRNKPENKIARVERHLLAFYGLNLSGYERMLNDQNGACAICEVPPKPGKKLNVDHDHETGKVRGLLCYGCNTAVGYINRIEKHKAKIDAYLERNK